MWVLVTDCLTETVHLSTHNVSLTRKLFYNFIPIAANVLYIYTILFICPLCCLCLEGCLTESYFGYSVKCDLFFIRLSNSAFYGSYFPHKVSGRYSFCLYLHSAIAQHRKKSKIVKKMFNCKPIVAF